MTLTPQHILDAHILIVDDQPANVSLLEDMLETAGYTQVSSTTDPTEVCALDQQTPFDLILLDLHMPGLDGFGVAAALRTLPGDQGRVPMIALTADPPEEVEQACRQAGFDAVLRKPFETRRLLGLIDALRGHPGSEGRPPRMPIGADGQRD